VDLDLDHDEAGWTMFFPILIALHLSTL
jgi:hypothetical protein